MSKTGVGGVVVKGPTRGVRNQVAPAKSTPEKLSATPFAPTAPHQEQGNALTSHESSVMLRHAANKTPTAIVSRIEAIKLPSIFAFVPVQILWLSPK